MKDIKTPKPAGKISRAQLREALDTVPLDSLFSPHVSKELTGKQKAFCKELAKGNTKAGAYRKAYNVTSKATMTSEPYKLAKNPVISNEVEAMKAAIAAAEYQTPAALRSLVIHSLVKVITDPDSKPGQITAAAKVLGTVTEVAAFTARSEHKVIRSSDDARAELMAQIREITNAQAVDVQAIDADADSLLSELAVGHDAQDVAQDEGDRDDVPEGEPHPTPTPQICEQESLVPMHTIPHERSPFGSHSDNSSSTNLPDSDTTPSTQDDPPSSSET